MIPRNDEATRRVVELYQQKKLIQIKPPSLRKSAKILGMNPMNVHWHLRKAAREGWGLPKHVIEYYKLEDKK